MLATRGDRDSLQLKVSEDSLSLQFYNAVGQWHWQDLAVATNQLVGRVANHELRTLYKDMLCCRPTSFVPPRTPTFPAYRHALQANRPSTGTLDHCRQIRNRGETEERRSLEEEARESRTSAS